MTESKESEKSGLHSLHQPKTIGQLLRESQLNRNPVTRAVYREILSNRLERLETRINKLEIDRK